MMRESGSNLWSFIFKPLCILILLGGLFGMVWLRSSVVSVSYELRTLEEKKMESLKEMKTLLADRSSAISLAKIDSSSLQGRGSGDNKVLVSGYVFPDRVKVIHVSRHKGPETYRASLDVKK